METGKDSASDTGSKGKTGGSVRPLLNGAGTLMTKEKVKAEVLNAFFASVFTDKTNLQQSPAPQTRGELWSKEDLPWVEADQVREHSNKLDTASPWV